MVAVNILVVGKTENGRTYKVHMRGQMVLSTKATSSTESCLVRISQFNGRLLELGTPGVWQIINSTVKAL